MPVSEIRKPTEVERSDVIVPGTPGTGGRPVRCIANYFPLELPTSARFYQYDVKFEPQVEGPGLARFLLRMHEGQLGDWIFDGRAIMWTQKPLFGEDEKSIELTSQGRDQSTQYRIIITKTLELSADRLGPAVLQVFNLVYRRSMRFLKLQQIGRNHFSMEQSIPVPRHNIKVLPGFLTTTYVTENGVLLNLDCIFRSLRTDSVLEFINNAKNRDRDNYRNTVEKELVGRVLLATYNNKTFYVDSIRWDLTPRDTFDREKGGRISYKDYFFQQYNANIRDLDQPLICCHRRRQNRDEFYVPELCSLTGLTDDMRADHSVMRDLKERTGLPPERRLRQQISFLDNSLKNKEFVDALKKWQFCPGEPPRPIQISGRVLPPPPVVFANDRKANLDENRAGSWNIRNDPLARIPRVDSWVVIAPPRCTQEVNRFIGILMQVSRPLGLSWPDPDVKFLEEAHEGAYIHALERMVNAERTSLALVVLPSDRKSLYDRVKQFLCLECPVPSQCVQLKTIKGEQGIHSKATKIAVQAISKMGGAPWTLNIQWPGRTMVIGIDVYHSGEIGPDRKKASIVGFTASMDSRLSTFYSRVVKNPPGQELIKVLEPCINAALARFRAIAKADAEYVIVYRDGVGEGQVPHVLEYEVKAVREALEASNSAAKLCWLVVLKRVNTRIFFQRDENSGVENPPPGTIIDTDITPANSMAFFLVSQHVNQGTATPTRFEVICNQPNFASNFLQDLSYKLCHIYYNWFGTVRVPAVCQYAHKVAFLVGQSLQREDSQQRLADRLYYL